MSRFALSRHITSPPLSCVHFNTNRCGKEVKSILTKEVFFTSFLGAVSGTSFGFLSFRLLFELIDKTTEIPFAIPSVNEELIVIFVSFLLTTILGPLCAAISIRKVCPKDILK